ncbi:hypothetical protein [Streptomyces sp. NRRL S-118]|uniref:hypothetical protein n=1 Tax=Streptomyces sp. NRRL S-118 TaxID=1463881 RepID=UPI001F435986|nr:hypothetical protein [Streptomyces sp. NRRL S-118]
MRISLAAIGAGMAALASSRRLAFPQLREPCTQTLDPEWRVCWWEERAGRLRGRSAHHEEQLQGEYAELRELGDLAVKEADVPPVQRLHWRIQDGEHALNQAEVALALTEHRLDNLREGA